MGMLGAGIDRRMGWRRRAWCALLAGAGLLLAGCGGGSTEVAPPTVAAPTIETAPAPASADDGGSAVFNVGARGEGLQYQWQRDGRDIAGADTARLELAAVTLADDGAMFRVSVRNDGGQVTSDAVRLTVHALAPSIAEPPAAAAVSVGQTATFSVKALGSAPLTYQWLRNGTPIDGATGERLTTAAATAADDGSRYAVRVSNAAGSVESAAALLSVSSTSVATPALACGPGGMHTLALRADGTVWAWGANGHGQVGDGTLVDRVQAAPIAGLSGIRQVAAGGTHSMFVDAQGRVWGVGSDAWGELGSGSAAASGLRSQVLRAGAIGNALAVAAGNRDVPLARGATMAVLEDGSLWGWGFTPAFGGQEKAGAGGLRYTGFPTVAQVVHDDRGGLVVVGQDGSLWYAGVDLTSGGLGTVTEPSPARRLAGIDQVASAALASTAIVVLKRDGTVWSWGSGPLGLPVATSTQVSVPTQVPGLSGIVRVALSDTMGMALKDDGTLYTWGSNVYGQLGRTTAPSVVFDTPRPVATGGRVHALCAGAMHSVFALADGSVWAAGQNFNKQLGNAEVFLTTATPVRVQGLELAP